MLVLIQVSSMKTRCWGSKLACHDRQRRRRRATSARACSRANSVFLNRSPSRRRNVQTALCETLTPRAASSSFSLCGVRCGVRRIRSLMKARCGSSTGLRCPPIWPGATEPVAPPVLRPLHHRGHRNTKPCRHRTAALASCHRRYHSLLQIIGKRSAHQMLAPAQPAS